MNNQKGQVQIIFAFLVIIVAVILFNVFSDSDNNETRETYSPGTVSPSGQNPGSSGQTIPAEDIALVDDKDFPVLSNGKPSGDIPAETRKITISLETDEKAICKYSVVSGVYYEQMQHFFSNTNSTFHSTLITGLSEDQEYEYYVRCSDEFGNKNDEEFDEDNEEFSIEFNVEEADDNAPPVRTNQYPTGTILPAGTTFTMIGISTDESASCYYSLDPDTSSGGSSLSSSGERRYHTARVGGLENGKTYNYFVRCYDLSGNRNEGNVMIYFSVTP